MSLFEEKKDICQDVIARQVREHWINLSLMTF